MDTEYQAQRMQCSRMDKQDLLEMVRILMELATHARNFGLLDLERRVNSNPQKYNDPFLRKAISTITDISNPAQVRNVLHNFIVSGNYSGRHFLKNLIISETCVAMVTGEDLDYMFSFLIPSYFGLEFDDYIQKSYREFRKTKNIEEV